MRWFLLLILLFSGSLHGQTILQKQADYAQNYLDLTFFRIAHSWEMMKHHFTEGNKKLKESANEKLPELPALPDKLIPGK